MRQATRRPVIMLVAAATVFASACHSSKQTAPPDSTAVNAPTTASTTTTTTTVPLGPAIVFSAQGSELDAYATTKPFATQTVVPSPAANANGVDVSGQICFDPTQPRRFVAVDRTDAADGQLGWGVFQLSGSALGKLSAQEAARLVPTFQPSRGVPRPFGCSFLPDGRLLTTDVGNRSSGPADGQLIEWFPPFDADTVATCKVAVSLAAPEGVLVDGDHVFVAQARGGGVTSFITSTLPTSNHASGGCTRKDKTGAALAVGVVNTPWLQEPVAHGLAQAAAIVAAGNGDFYVASPRSGVIAEVDADGNFVRLVVAPPAGEVLGARPFLTGSPVGLGVDPDGTLYYADSGLVVRDATTVAGLRTGTIRRVTFSDGSAEPPVVVDSGLQAPDGIGIWIPSP